MARHVLQGSELSEAVRRIQETEGHVALTTSELAAALHVSEIWLAKQRSKGLGCPFVRLGPSIIRYRKSDVLQWLETLAHNSTAEYEPHQKGNIYGRRGKAQREGE
jgi:hypothetical protein